jgi:hypothetical protein
MQRLVSHLVVSIEDFRGIDVSRLLVSATFNRSNRRAGLIAYVLPLRYREGSPIERRVRGTKSYHYAMLPYRHEGREILYIIYFMLPRFQNLSWRDKLETVIHELYHISPHFNGDLRRLKGRSHVHGNSLQDYDRRIKELTDSYLERFPEVRDMFDFLKMSFGEMESKWGEVIAQHVREPKPKLLKIH